MNEKKILRRKITLKNQAIKLIRIERDTLKQRVHLLSLKEQLEKRVARDFNPSVSRQLDCVAYLLQENLNE